MLWNTALCTRRESSKKAISISPPVGDLGMPGERVYEKAHFTRTSKYRKESGSQTKKLQLRGEDPISTNKNDTTIPRQLFRRYNT